MLNIPEQIKKLFLTDGIQKNFRVKFLNADIPDLTNNDIVQGSIKFTESACSQDEFKFGLCEASQIEFECYNLRNVKKKAIQCFIEIDVTSLSIPVSSYTENNIQTNEDLEYPFYQISLGKFIINSCPREDDEVYYNDKTGSMSLTKRSITAYGPSYDFNWDLTSIENSIVNYYNKYTGEINIFKWMFCNFMQGNWENFFSEKDFTVLTMSAKNDWSTGCSWYTSNGDNYPNLHWITGPAIEVFIDNCSYSLYDNEDKKNALYYLKKNRDITEDLEAIKKQIDDWYTEYAINSNINIRFIANVTYASHYTNKKKTKYKTATISIKSKEEFYKLCVDPIKFGGIWRLIHVTNYNKYGDINFATMDDTSFPIDPNMNFVCFQAMNAKDISSLLCTTQLTMRVNTGHSSDDYQYPATKKFNFVDNIPNNELLYKVDTSRYDDMLIDLSVLEEIDPKSIVEGYLELDGRLGRYNRYGNLEFYNFNSQITEYIPKAEYEDCVYEDSYTKNYDRISVTYENLEGVTKSTYLQFIRKKNTIGVDGDEYDVDNESEETNDNQEDDEETIDSDFILYVEDYNKDDYQTYSLGYNYLIQNCRFSKEQIDSYLENLARKLINVKYLPFDMDLVGRPWLEAGDNIIIDNVFENGLSVNALPVILSSRSGYNVVFPDNFPAVNNLWESNISYKIKLTPYNYVMPVSLSFQLNPLVNIEETSYTIRLKSTKIYSKTFGLYKYAHFEGMTYPESIYKVTNDYIDVNITQTVSDLKKNGNYTITLYFPVFNVDPTSKIDEEFEFDLEIDFEKYDVIGKYINVDKEYFWRVSVGNNYYTGKPALNAETLVYDQKTGIGTANLSYTFRNDISSNYNPNYAIFTFILPEYNDTKVEELYLSLMLNIEDNIDPNTSPLRNRQFQIRLMPINKTFYIDYEKGEVSRIVNISSLSISNKSPYFTMEIMAGIVSNSNNYDPSPYGQTMNMSMEFQISPAYTNKTVKEFIEVPEDGVIQIGAPLLIPTPFDVYSDRYSLKSLKEGYNFIQDEDNSNLWVFDNIHGFLEYAFDRYGYNTKNYTTNFYLGKKRSFITNYAISDIVNTEYSMNMDIVVNIMFKILDESIVKDIIDDIYDIKLIHSAKISDKINQFTDPREGKAWLNSPTSITKIPIIFSMKNDGIKPWNWIDFELIDNSVEQGYFEDVQDENFVWRAIKISGVDVAEKICYGMWEIYSDLDDEEYKLEYTMKHLALLYVYLNDKQVIFYNHTGASSTNTFTKKIHLKKGKNVLKVNASLYIDAMVEINLKPLIYDYRNFSRVLSYNIPKNKYCEFDFAISGMTIIGNTIDPSITREQLEFKTEIEFPEYYLTPNPYRAFSTSILRRNMNVDYFLEDSFEARGE